MHIRVLLTISLLVPASCLIADDGDIKNILMIAGRPSHGFGSHEHYAGLKILEESIEASTDQIDVTVVKGWPEDASLLKNADSIVIYSDGGGGHPAIKHLEELTRQLETGCGFVCIHYAVEMVPGPPGDFMVQFLGGHFEIHWSVNPHWVADFQELPDHPRYPWSQTIRDQRRMVLSYAVPGFGQCDTDSRFGRARAYDAPQGWRAQRKIRRYEKV